MSNMTSCQQVVNQQSISDFAIGDTSGDVVEVAIVATMRRNKETGHFFCSNIQSSMIGDKKISFGDKFKIHDDKSDEDTVLKVKLSIGDGRQKFDATRSTSKLEDKPNVANNI